MKFLKKLSALFSTPARDENGYYVTVECAQCGETIRTRVNLANDLSLEYGDGGKATYFCRKVMMGTARCFQKIEVALTFDGNRNVLDRQITGGKFLDT
jgi:hypothetical protein